MQFGRPGREEVLGAGIWHSRRRRLYEAMDSALLKAYPRRHGDLFSPGLFGFDPSRYSIFRSVDIVHLHWVANGFLNLRALRRLDVPVVWTMRDMWPFTGGCHYTHGSACQRFRERCGSCPHLGGNVPVDLSSIGWQNKRLSYTARIHPVAISRWLQNQAKESSLLGERPVRVIHNCIDTEVFHPTPPHEARARLGLPPDARVILFGANSPSMDRRKGFQELLQALASLRQTENLFLVTFGDPASTSLGSLSIPFRSLGRIEDEESLAQTYSAADLFVGPSLQEAFGKTIAEAMSCATPVVAFQGTGPAEIVAHLETGFLAEPGDSVRLAEGIEWLLDMTPGELRNLRARARRRAITYFGLEAAAREYKTLYEELLRKQ
jgi:glycosyltransferase involved in cell wall biosynthesis